MNDRRANETNRNDTSPNATEMNYTHLRAFSVSLATLFRFILGSTPYLAVHIRLFSVSVKPFMCLFRSNLGHVSFTSRSMSDTEMGPNGTEMTRMVKPT